MSDRDFIGDAIESLKQGKKKTVNEQKDIIQKKIEKLQCINKEKMSYFSQCCCSDQYVGKISDVLNRDKFFTDRKNIDNNILSKIGEEPILVMILESPHKAEFFIQTGKKTFDERRTPPSPAMGEYYGDTGCNIINFFQKIFDDKFDNYHLILMNAIQFQCSLGQEPAKTYRDIVFPALWDYRDKNEQYPYRNNFEKRLEEIINFSNKGKGKLVIINACTTGVTVDEKLCRKVCAVIHEQIKNKEFPYCHLGHPSYWSCHSDQYKKAIRTMGDQQEKCSKGNKCKECPNKLNMGNCDLFSHHHCICFNTAFKDLFQETKKK